MPSARATDPADSIRVSPFVLTWPRLLGLSLDEVARASGLSRELLESAKDLSYEETLSLWRALETLTEDPVVGLHAGMRFTIDQMGVVGPALAHASNLDAAIDVLARMMGVFVKNARIGRVDDEHGAGFEYCMPTLRSRHGVDTIFAATVALVRHCTGSCGPSERRGRGPLVPLRVEHQMPALGESEYERFFGVRPVWNTTSSRLWFSRADLALPFLGASPALAELLSANAARLLSEESTESRFEQDFERAFWAAQTHGEATLESTAEALGVSGRTLQRRLTSNGTTFADVRGKLLVRRANELLAERSLSLDVIAGRLGYSSRSAFERAFVRWTGKTPNASRDGR